MSSEWCWKEVKSNTKSNNVGAGVDGSDGDKYLSTLSPTPTSPLTFSLVKPSSPPLSLSLYIALASASKLPPAIENRLV